MYLACCLEVSTEQPCQYERLVLAAEGPETVGCAAGGSLSRKRDARRVFSPEFYDNKMANKICGALEWTLCRQIAFFPCPPTRVSDGVIPGYPLLLLCRMAAGN